MFVLSKIKKNREKIIFSLLFYIYPCFLKLFHQKVWVKYQLGDLNICLLVKNLITNIRAKFKIFQILFPLILSCFPTLIIFVNYQFHWIPSCRYVCRHHTSLWPRNKFVIPNQYQGAQLDIFWGGGGGEPSFQEGEAQKKQAIV